MPHAAPDLDKVARRAPPQIARERREEVARLLGRDNTHFPGAQPVSFVRRHLEQLKQRDYYVCEKSDGIRCLLYFTVEHDAANAPHEMHYLIDRKNDYYGVDEVGFHVPLPPPAWPADKAEAPAIDWASFHTETLLDGELIVDTEPNGQQVTKYFVFDTLAVDGQTLLQRPLDKRLAYFMDRVYRPYEALCNRFPDDARAMAFQLRNKAFEFSYGVGRLFDVTIPRLKHGSDGIIFTCRDSPYRFGTDENILKWKPADENTVDFRMALEFPPYTTTTTEEEDDGQWDKNYDATPAITLFVNAGEHGHTPFATLHLEPDEWAGMKAYSVAHSDGLDGAVVECRRDAEQRWRFHRFREDKTDANFVGVVRKVVESIDDGVSRAEIVANEPGVRAAWKARQAAVQSAAGAGKKA